MQEREEGSRCREKRGMRAEVIPLLEVSLESGGICRSWKRRGRGVGFLYTV